MFGWDDSFCLAVRGSHPGVATPFGSLLLLLSGDVAVFCLKWIGTPRAFPFQAFGSLPTG